MKKVILVFALFIFGLQTNAQIKEIETNSTIQISKMSILGTTYITFNKNKDSNDYFILYRDKQYSQLIDFKNLPIGNKETVIQLKELMLGMLKAKTEKKAIELNNYQIHFKKRSNTIEMTIYNEHNQMSIVQFINKKQINKLFNVE